MSDDNIIHFNPWQDFNDAPSIEDPFDVEPDPAQIETFLDVVFGYCEGQIPVRGFVDMGQGKEGRPHNIWIDADTTAPGKLATFANWAWREGAAVYVIPGTVTAAGQAKSADVLQMQALVVDLDAGDIPGKLDHLLHHLGQPTLIIESGGRTSEGASKLHVWWRMTEPAEGTALAELCRLRGEIALKVGGDTHFRSAHQPIRVAGSVHHKHGHQRLVQIREHHSTEVDLDDFAERVAEMPPIPGAGMASTGTAAPGKPSLDAVLTTPVREGDQDEWSRFTGASAAIGHFLRMVHEGRMSPDEGWEAIRGYNAAALRPSWPEDRLKAESERLWAKHIEKNGPPLIRLETSAAAQNQPGPLSSFTLGALLDDRSPMPEDIIAPRVLTPGGMLVLGGAPKVGKSDFLISWLVHMAAGIPFLGFTPPRPLRIFYLQAEIQYHYLRERLQQIALSPEVIAAARTTFVATPKLKLLLNEAGIAKVIEAIVGDIDVLMGAPSQAQNDYLAANAGADVPGYRGICSLVLRQVFLGLNPYLKPWSVRLTRILKAEDGGQQWYPEKAQIVPEVRIGDAAIYIAMDASGSMSGSRMAAQIAAVSRLVEEIGENALEPNDVQIVTWNSTVSGTILRRDADVTAYGELKDWVDALSSSVSGGTDFGVAVSQAGAFFNGSGGKRRILIFVTDGEPSPASTLQTAITTLSGISEVDVFAFNIALSDTSATAQIDNTPVDGVPVVPPGDPDALAASLRAAFGQGPEMNPAHIIRESLINGDWGLGHTFADIGPSFAIAADALFSEGFGLSLLWQRESTIEDFIADVLKHIDAYLYVDRRSGRWELRLIRADYDPETLPVFDETNVVDWGELGRRVAADLVNSVTAKFSDARTDQTGSVSVTDTALVQDLGQVVSATVDYPGIRFESLAVRVAERDLRALSAPILSGEITVSRVGANLDPGDVIVLSSPRRSLEGVVVRIVEIDHGDGRANGVRLRVAEDVFALGETALVGGESGNPGSLILPPKPLTRRWVAEAPYWLLVQELGHAQADALLDEDPHVGAIVATGERPSADALSAQVWSDSGAGYTLEEAVEFVPTALLLSDVSDDPAENVLTVGGWTGLGDVAIGTLAAIGDELVRIDGVSATALTVGRGCLDTVPLAHPAGTPVICWQQLANASEAGFVAAETVTIKMLPETGFGTLPLAQAPEDAVTLASRAIRPLPPGDLRGNGVSVVNPNVLNLGPVLLTWSHRDRLTQTSSVFDAYDAGDIGSEPGVTYALEIRWVDPDTDATIEPPAAVIDVGVANSITLTKEDVPILAAPTGTKHFEVRVQARRTTGTITYEAWQARSIRLFMPDGIKVAEVSAWTEIGAEARLTVAETVIFLDRGGAVQLTIAEAAIWIGFGSDARLTIPDIDIFNEWGGQSRLTAAEAALYIEVIP